MSYANEELRATYDRTSGRCHICKKRLSFCNYGQLGQRGAWEVDHSNPRARGGSDRRSNRLPACISCNRRKRDQSTRAARAQQGRSRKPMSEEEIAKARRKNTGLGAGIGAAVGVGSRLAGTTGPVGLVIGVAEMLVGGAIGASIDPDHD